VALNGRHQQVAGAPPWHALRHDLGRLLAHLAMTRDLRAGLLVGGAALCRIGNAGGVGAPGGLAVGDTVQLDLAGADGQSVFGAIVQRVAGPPAAGGGEPASQAAGDDAAPA
jgi:fumarylacetoacetate (FAA) hydrolase